MSIAESKRWWVRWVYSPLQFTGEVAIFLWEGLRRIFRKPFELAETLNQMLFVGMGSVPIVLLTTFASGAVMALYISPLLLRMGVGSMVGGTVGLTVARELGPVVAGIMVAARCGSAMAAQIGSMAVTEQIDALRALGVNPYGYLLVPRLLATVLMLPVLGLVGIYSGIVGGMLVGTIHGIPMSTFLESVDDMMDPWDFVGGLVKTMVFGLIVAIVACQQGFRTEGGAVGVGRSTTDTVVISMVMIYLVNYFLAAWFF
ncbi:MAG: ABC transporter permease [Armatimonadota bacterium]|nr:ABC transporter permease [Armatimonadota bacterium]